MTLLDTSLQSLRAYPPALVLTLFVIVVGLATWVFAKLLKWSVYVLAVLVFAALTALFALWLWP